jgi:hypothetical protein
MTIETVLALAQETHDMCNSYVNVHGLVLMHSATGKLYVITSAHRESETVRGPGMNKRLPASEFEPTYLGFLPS